MRRPICVIGAAAFGLTAPAASAGTLSYRANDCYEGSHFCTTTTIYRAAPGERNDVTYTRDETGATVRDAGAEVRPAARCRAIDAHAAHCPAPDLTLELGDGDDRAAPGNVTAIAGGVGIDGGGGQDILIGAAGPDYLQGGDGADAITGAAGDDQLIGGAGADVLDGADGVDRASYFGGPPVVVDLADPGPDGPPGEPDVLAGIEQVLGSDGADVLRGDAQANWLQGGRGDDILSGGPGDDEIFGGTGFDRLDGGSGDDELAPDFEGGAGTPPAPGDRDPAGEPVSCGDGFDLVTEQARDILDGCERLELPLGLVAPSFDPRPVFSGGAAVLRLRCSFLLMGVKPRICRVRVTLSAGGRQLGTRTLRVKGHDYRVRVPLRRRPVGPLDLRVSLRYVGRLPGDDDRALTAYFIRVAAE